MQELTIETPNGQVGLPDQWLAFVMRELRAPDGFVIVDDGRPHSFAQARNHDGVLLLEYRDGSADRHFQVKGVTTGDVARALSQWADGERRFVEDHVWRRLEL